MAQSFPQIPTKRTATVEMEIREISTPNLQFHTSKSLLSGKCHFPLALTEIEILTRTTFQWMERIQANSYTVIEWFVYDTIRLQCEISRGDLRIGIMPV